MYYNVTVSKSWDIITFFSMGRFFFNTATYDIASVLQQP